MKTIEYRGGVLRFRIPDTWVEEYEPEGGGTFYLDAPESGTLRLNILTFEGTAMPTQADLVRALQKSGDPETLPSGNAIVEYTSEGEERGEALRFYHWKLAGAVAPKHVRLAVFSYTLLARIAADQLAVDEVHMLGQEIRAAVFAPTLGVVNDSSK